MNAGAKRCHLVGVAGVGMNALAQALRGTGWNVSGSDRYADQGQDLDVIGKLKHAGIHFFPQNGSGISATTDAVVVSTAIEDGNPDLAAAERLGVPIRHRAEMLVELVAGRELVAVAGTSGKTTVAGIIGWLLEQAGADPTVVNGGALVNWAGPKQIGNVRIGKSGPCVVEVDESDRSLLRFSPDWAVITNASADHFSVEETKELFGEFQKKVRRKCVVGWDRRMPWRKLKAELSGTGARFSYAGVDFEVPMLGAHNAENALQAIVMCERLGFKPDRLAGPLKAFRGIQRRLERVGQGHGVTVIDEYAHNPAKIAAAWEAVAPYHGRVIGFWRPHGFKPLSLMFDGLVELFGRLCRPNDRLFLMPVYFAGGTVTRLVDAHQLAHALREKGVPVVLAEDYDQLMAGMLGEVCEGDVVLCMGARDPGISAFASRLAARACA
jgi:UDP-N-acetylmuramate--alanine ligase